jgi:ABC-2 type transport system ATP-binding protein
MQLEISQLKKTFGEKVAVDVQSYNVGDGEIIGLVGNNGAGKTTLFRLILDLLKPDNGHASINGVITSQSEEWKAVTGGFIDEGFLIDFLTPDEYFDFICKIHAINRDEYEQRIKKYEHIMNGEIVGVDKLIRNLSAGNKQKVGIIGAMLHNPQLLILDEPFNFLDPSSQLAMKKVLEEFSKELGATVIVSSHNLTHTFDLCTRITLLEEGKIIKDGRKGDESVFEDIEQYFIHKA